MISDVFTVGSVTQFTLKADLPASAPPAMLSAICDGSAAGAAAEAALGAASPEITIRSAKIADVSLDVFVDLYT